MINSNKELFKWGPIDGRVIYVDSFLRAFIPYSKAYVKGWSDAIGYYINDSITFVLDYEHLRNNGGFLFKKYVMNEKILTSEYEKWFKVAKDVDKTAEFVNSSKFSKISETELNKQFKAWIKTHDLFWVTGFLPEVANWGGEKLLKNKLSSLQNLTHEQFIDILEKLTAPEELSFFQKEELEMLKIKSIPSQEQEKALQEHQQKYYWLRNSYGFTKVLDVDFFREEINKFSSDEAKKKIESINSFIDKVKENKKISVEKYKIPKNIIGIASKLAYCIWWQDYRKSFIFKSNHILTCFMKEIGKRKEIPFKDMCYYQAHEVFDLLDNNKIIDAKVRSEGFMQYYHEKENKLTTMLGKEANDFIKPYINAKLDKNINEFSGVVVSKGDERYSFITKGKVKIINTPRKMDHMQNGDILVAAMTSPDFIVAMRKASAIITDEGGMTCHAAIVSRELGVPCIVGTKIATKVLKDNDLVEIDAKKGIVRKVK
jgi:phosphohistidine swiveling domain-containing protein